MKINCYVSYGVLFWKFLTTDGRAGICNNFVNKINVLFEDGHVGLKPVVLEKKVAQDKNWMCEMFNI
jgi:prepilin-type processing-associated H-X9-DG protein